MVLDKATGELVERTTYEAYGNTESDYRPDRRKNFREDYKFTGKEEDIEVGLQYFGYRYYAPALNRWISADPLTIHSLGADLNAYAYVSGKVLAATDPMGLAEEKQGTTSETKTTQTIKVGTVLPGGAKVVALHPPPDLSILKKNEQVPGKIYEPNKDDFEMPEQAAFAAVRRYQAWTIKTKREAGGVIYTVTNRTEQQVANDLWNGRQMKERFYFSNSYSSVDTRKGTGPKRPSVIHSKEELLKALPKTIKKGYKIVIVGDWHTHPRKKNAPVAPGDNRPSKNGFSGQLGSSDQRDGDIGRAHVERANKVNKRNPNPYYFLALGTSYGDFGLYYPKTKRQHYIFSTFLFPIKELQRASIWKK
jgi:RHS repeat-associated protein